jgi:hypothetical protein
MGARWRPGGGAALRVPHPVQDLRAAHHVAGPAQQELEEAELARGQVDTFAGPPHLRRRGVEHEVAGNQPRRPRRCGPPDERAQPCGQHDHRERLDQVVVGAELGSVAGTPDGLGECPTVVPHLPRSPLPARRCGYPRRRSRRAGRCRCPRRRRTRRVRPPPDPRPSRFRSCPARPTGRPCRPSLPGPGPAAGRSGCRWQPTSRRRPARCRCRQAPARPARRPRLFASDPRLLLGRCVPPWTIPSIDAPASEDGEST